VGWGEETSEAAWPGACLDTCVSLQEALYKHIPNTENPNSMSYGHLCWLKCGWLFRSHVIRCWGWYKHELIALTLSVYRFIGLSVFGSRNQAKDHVGVQAKLAPPPTPDNM